MANKKISEGVGKKIVEALKKQSEIEVNPMSSNTEQEEIVTPFDDLSESITDDSQDTFETEDFISELPSDDYLENLASQSEEHSIQIEEMPMQQINQPFINYQQPAAPVHDNFIKELDNFEIPSNIAVLKKLISQLPSGVTRHTGAQIIKQTMEALGISMKSVLQEAQQVQDGLSNSAKECHSTIQEYKKQITVLEKQAQNHQRQYAALNELISLFIQTGV